MTEKQKQEKIDAAEARWRECIDLWCEASERCDGRGRELVEADNFRHEARMLEVDEEPPDSTPPPPDFGGLCTRCWRPRRAHLIDGACPSLGTHVSIDAASVERAMGSKHPRLLWLVVCGAKRTALVDVEVEHLRVGERVVNQHDGRRSE